MLLIGIWPFLEPVGLFHVLTETQTMSLYFKRENTTVRRREGDFGTQELSRPLAETNQGFVLRAGSGYGTVTATEDAVSTEDLLPRPK